MKKTILGLALILFTSFLAGCGAKPEEKKEETINPFSPSSMVDTYETSKGKINDATQKQNDNINKAIEESGINE